MELLGVVVEPASHTGGNHSSVMFKRGTLQSNLKEGHPTQPSVELASQIAQCLVSEYNQEG